MAFARSEPVLAAPTHPALTGDVRRSLQAAAGPLLTVREVASRLGVCTATVYALCEAGTLPSMRVLGRNTIRVAPADLEAFLAARLTGGR